MSQSTDPTATRASWRRAVNRQNASAPAQALTASARNGRVDAILNSPDAEGREAMAEHLAYRISQSPEAAIALLSAAPRAQGSWAGVVARINARVGAQANALAGKSSRAKVVDQLNRRSR